MDAIQLLKQQHVEVEKLFKEIEACEDDEREELRRLFVELADNLAAHAEIEEQFFYPAVKLKQTEDIVQHSLEEHFQMKQLLAQMLDLEPGDSEFLQLCTELKGAVMDHVEEEQDEMFPAVRKLFTRDELTSLGDEMQAKFDELISGEPRYQVREELEAPAQI
jgi:hemerythrin superfamily protein